MAVMKNAPVLQQQKGAVAVLGTDPRTYAKNGREILEIPFPQH